MTERKLLKLPVSPPTVEVGPAEDREREDCKECLYGRRSDDGLLGCYHPDVVATGHRNQPIGVLASVIYNDECGGDWKVSRGP